MDRSLVPEPASVVACSSRANGEASTAAGDRRGQAHVGGPVNHNSGVITGSTTEAEAEAEEETGAEAEAET
jgi:hypothetical protein